MIIIIFIIITSWQSIIFISVLTVSTCFTVTLSEAVYIGSQRAFPWMMDHKFSTWLKFFITFSFTLPKWCQEQAIKLQKKKTLACFSWITKASNEIQNKEFLEMLEKLYLHRKNIQVICSLYWKQTTSIWVDIELSE